jgi:DNA-binding MarR family transcriptional regulator
LHSGRDTSRAGRPPRPREEIYREIQDDGQRLAAGLIRVLHAMSVGFGLNPSDFQAYTLLSIEGPMTPGEIAQWLKLATGSVTALLDRLEARGLVVRDRHPEDRRKVVVRPAPLAAADPGSGWPGGIRDAMLALHGHYSEAELEIIADWLRRTTETLNEIAARSHD